MRSMMLNRWRSDREVPKHAGGSVLGMGIVHQEEIVGANVIHRDQILNGFHERPGMPGNARGRRCAG